MKLQKWYRCAPVLVILMAPALSQAAVNLLTNPGAESGTGNDAGSTVTSWTVGGTSNPGRDDGTFDTFTVPFGSYMFYGGHGASGSLSQTVDLLANGYSPSSLDTGTASAAISFSERSLSQGTPSDSGGVQITFQDAAHAPLSGGTTLNATNTSAAFLQFGTSTGIPTGTRFITYTMNFTLNNGNDLDAFIDNNSLTLDAPQTAATPEPASLALLLPATLALLARRRKILT